MFFNNIALSIVLGASPAFANLVQDGSFENILVLGYTNTDGCPCAGYGTGSMGVWTVSVQGNVVGVFQRGAFPGANVTDGNYAFTLGIGGDASGNSISQVLPTVTGQTYRLSFDWGSEYARGTSAFVSVGNLNENLHDPVRAQEDYTSTPHIVNSSSFLFVASGNDRLTFGEPDEPFDWYGLVLDNIIVEPVSPPQLAIIRSGPNLVLSWPTDATGFVLESATTLSNGGDWKDSNLTVTEINGQNIVTLTPIGPRAFFRLRGP